MSESGESLEKIEKTKKNVASKTSKEAPNVIFREEISLDGLRNVFE